MNNTDIIIKYLSGEMQQDEIQRFDLLRSTDPELEHEFQSIQKIWEIMRVNLMLEDLPEEKIRDKLIAEVMAHQDIERFRNQQLSKKAAAFRSALIKAEAATKQPWEVQNSRSKWFRTPTILLAAASLALLFLVLRPSTSLQELAHSYYDPAGSELASQHAFKTRSNEARALQFFRDRNYDAARYYFEVDMNVLREDHMARLFYGISCQETGDTDKAIAVLQALALTDDTSSLAPAAYHAKWYLSLILVNEGRTEEAIPLLVELSRTEGAFNKKSTRLLRKIE
jgi:hypothetical protein